MKKESFSRRKCHGDGILRLCVAINYRQLLRSRESTGAFWPMPKSELGTVAILASRPPTSAFILNPFRFIYFSFSIGRTFAHFAPA
jgi:hypothetical protein